MRWFLNLFLGADPGMLGLNCCRFFEPTLTVEEQREKLANMWTASPIVAPSHANLAPASIHCAEFDVLRSEGVAYNVVLNKAGTHSTVKVYKGVCHPWGHWDGQLDKAKEYVSDTVDALKEAYTRS